MRDDAIMSLDQSEFYLFTYIGLHLTPTPTFTPVSNPLISPLASTLPQFPTA